jgi:molybdate transport system regulatory protein
MAKSMSAILSKDATFTVKGSIWIECNGSRFFGPGPVELLERIDNTGSINQAAKQMQMSYKKAWEIIHRLNANAAVPLVETNQGGKHGGGSTISKEAREMIAFYRQMREKFSKFLEQAENQLNQ